MKKYKSWVKNDFYMYDQENKQYISKWHMVDVQIMYINKNKIRGGWINEEGKRNTSEFTKFILLEPVGIQDINGKDIYEGDILEFGIVSKVDGSDSADLGMELGFYLQRDNFESWRLLEVGEELEVLGNIYENPELLNS